jgi:hypothetical protein
MSAIAFPVAPAYGRVDVFACIRFNVKRKGFIPLLATWATVTGIHSFVWFKYVALVIHFFLKLFGTWHKWHFIRAVCAVNAKCHLIKYAFYIRPCLSS